MHVTCKTEICIEAEPSIHSIQILLIFLRHGIFINNICCFCRVQSRCCAFFTAQNHPLIPCESSRCQIELAKHPLQISVEPQHIPRITRTYRMLAGISLTCAGPFYCWHPCLGFQVLQLIPCQGRQAPGLQILCPMLFQHVQQLPCLHQPCIQSCPPATCAAHHQYAGMCSQ
jgi:hypothetical protein